MPRKRMMSFHSGEVCIAVPAKQYRKWNHETKQHDVINGAEVVTFCEPFDVATADQAFWDRMFEAFDKALELADPREVDLDVTVAGEPLGKMLIEECKHKPCFAITFRTEGTEPVYCSHECRRLAINSRRNQRQRNPIKG